MIVAMGLGFPSKRALPGAHILVVDDMSPDGTGDIADELASREPRLHVEHRSGPRGLGPAYAPCGIHESA